MEDYNNMLVDRIRKAGRLLRRRRGPLSEMAGDDRCEKDFRRFRRESLLIPLSDREEGIRQNVIAERMHISPSTLSETLDKLSADGYIERRPDPDDRRATLVAVTSKGKERAEELEALNAMMLSKLFENLDEDEKAQLVKLIDKLLAGLEKQ